MTIRVEPHTLKRAEERGAAVEEIVETINSGTPFLAKGGRLAKRKVFDFDATRNGKFYPQKQLEVFYLVEADEIITITVYVYFGKFDA